MSKDYKGQIQVIEGSFVEHAVTTTKFAKTSSLMIEYVGECKYGTRDEENLHHINKLTYDSSMSIDTMLTALNRRQIRPTTIAVDASDVSNISVTIVGGTFADVNAGDSIYINTTLNPGKNFKIKQVVSSTVILLDNISSVVTEAAVSPASNDDVVVTLENSLTKDFSKRRWDFRELYIYV